MLSGGVILSGAKDPLIAYGRASPEGILRFAQDDKSSFASQLDSAQTRPLHFTIPRP